MTSNTGARRNEQGGGFSVFDTLRRWWQVPVLGMLLAAAAAGLAAPQAPTTSTAALLLHTTATDTQGIERQAQGILAEAESSAAISDAARALGVDADDLRLRTELAIPSDALVMHVQTRADSPEEAAQAANAVAEAILTTDAQRLQGQLAEVSRTTSDLIKSSPMADPTADRARVNRLAEGMAEVQSQLISQSRRVLPLRRAEAEPTPPSSRAVFVLMGALGGLLAGVGFVVYFGARRGRVRSTAELRRLFPATDVVNTAELVEAVSVNPVLDTVVIVDRDSVGSQGALRRIAQACANAGIEATMAQPGPDSHGRAGHPDNGHEGGVGLVRGGDPSRVVTLVGVTGTGSTLRRYANDPSTLVVHPVKIGRTRLEDVDLLVRATPSVSFVVVEGGSDGSTSDGAAGGRRDVAKVR